MANSVTRLFSQFRPSDYKLTLDIDKENQSFSGVVEITGDKVGRPSKRITLHQKELKISEGSITPLSTKAKPVTIERINKQAKFDELRIHTKELVYPGSYLIKVAFSGQITKPMHGIYPCFYKHDGKDKQLIASQFESHHAREAFPCIDEPEAKATFNLTLISDNKEVALSNTPIKEQKVLKDKLVTSFETTPIMSSYLLAFVCGEMHSVTTKAKSGIAVSSWSTVAQPVSHLEYANNEAAKTVDFFNDYFNTPFPLKKIDQVALPDFEALAMENWGLITFREVGLLADPINRSLSGEQLISLVIAHEMSHQWFGDLVTMKWWDDLWLNESFASIMENIAPDRLHPDWQQWEDFATGRILSCSHRDIYKDVQSVAVKVSHPDEITSLFDPAIVYAKGARLINMLYEYIGEAAFRKGLEAYFKEHAYKNTTRDDLWKALGAVSHTDVESLMTPWLIQSGQPLLSVKRNKDKLSLSQKRFLMDGEDNDSLWPIPLLADQKLSIDILDKVSLDIPISDNQVPLFNVNGNGHYIVHYEDKDVRESLAKKVIDRSVSSISRVNLLNDMLLLSRIGKYKLSEVLEVINKCPQEPREAVWSMFMRVVGQAQTLTDGNKATEQHIRVFKRNLSSYWYEKLGWQDKPKDDPNTKHLRTTMLALSIAGENKAALEQAYNLYDNARSVEKLPAEQRALITGAVVRRGQEKDLKALMEEYVSSPNPDVQQSIAVALCTTRDNDVAKKIIKWGLSQNGPIRHQDIGHWFAYLMRNHYARDLIWEWFTDNWDYLMKLFSDGKYMDYFVWYASGPVSTRDWQAKFIEFFKPKEAMPSLSRNIQIAYSEIEARVLWRERDEADLADYFK